MTRYARWWPRRSRASRRASTPTALTAGLLAVAGHAAGAAGRRRCAARPAAAPTGCRSSTSSCRWPAATSRARRRWCSATWCRCGASTARPDLLSSYADALAELPDAPLRGYLTGSIDAVLRVGSPTDRRYLVVDYKTNRLGGHDEPLTAWHYRPAALETAMVEAHYPLQALLYAVALHRYLRWRQPGYDPDGAPRRRALPVPARHVRAGRASAPTARRPACSAGGRRSGWSPGCPTCWRGSRMTTTSTRRWRCGPTGCSATFNRAGILSAADVHVARRLGAIGGETDEAVLLAVALVVRSTRHGSVVLDLTTAEATTSPDVDEDETDGAGGRRRARLAGRLGGAVRGEPAGR